MKSLQGKTILLTGAAGGFGGEFIRQLLSLGADLALTDIDLDRLQETVDKIRAEGSSSPGKVIGMFAADLAKSEGCEEAYRRSREIWPATDILINNAGILTFGDFRDVPREKWETLVSLNLLAPMRLAHLFLPDMTARRSGHIVNMCSVAGFAATAQGTPYSTSKFGLRGFGMALAKEVAGKGVAVTNIYPFWARTEILDSPSYGKAKIRGLRSIFIDDPEMVIRQSIRGLRQEKLHVYPGLWAKLANLACRLTPIVGHQAR